MRKILVITGPTASGKSSIAFKAAEEFNGEIISADSMQVYRGLDIGTAKPSLEEQRAVPHHLIDVMDIEEPLDVYAYLRMAAGKIDSIRSKGRLPVVAGGTGFYIHALLYGLDPLPGDSELRKSLDEKYESAEGFEALKKIMKEKAPADYERWHSHRRKLIRALEVFELTGRPITELQSMKEKSIRYPVVSWCLSWDREELKDRIRKRTHEMLSAGWIEEAEKMLKNGLLSSPTAHQALGYRTIGEYIAGKMSFEEMEDRISVSTWQLARRQITWFKNKHPESEMISMPTDYRVLSEKLKKSFAQ